MAKYVPDIGSQRWVIISPGRVARPEDSASRVKQSQGHCPFCTGSEGMTPPEVYRLGGGEKDKSGWEVRVVPNLYPITDTHEVIIHSTEHEKDIEDLPVSQVAKILTVYRDRYRAHEDDGQVLIFCNHGKAGGASLAHPHSQLVVVPRQINLDTIAREPVANIVRDNTHFVTYCPDFSQWPFEVWIAPKAGEVGKFGDMPSEQLADLAEVLQQAIQSVRKAHDKKVLKPLYPDSEFVYNYYIYHGANWYLRIIPRFVHRAGFELGTGLNVNIMDPTEAARILRSVFSD